MMHKLLLLSILLGSCQPEPAQVFTGPDRWAPLKEILGTWKSDGPADHDGSAGDYFTLRMGSRNNLISGYVSPASCAEEWTPRCRYNVSLFLYIDSRTFKYRAIYIDGDERVLLFDAANVQPHSIVFLSPPGDWGSEFVLTIETRADAISLEIDRHPPKSSETETICRWKGTRVSPPA